jgi:hypothetical protein
MTLGCLTRHPYFKDLVVVVVVQKHTGTIMFCNIGHAALAAPLQASCSAVQTVQSPYEERLSQYTRQMQRQKELNNKPVASVGAKSLCPHCRTLLQLYHKTMQQMLYTATSPTEDQVGCNHVTHVPCTVTKGANNRNS